MRIVWKSLTAGSGLCLSPQHLPFTISCTSRWEHLLVPNHGFISVLLPVFKLTGWDLVKMQLVGDPGQENSCPDSKSVGELSVVVLVGNQPQLPIAFKMFSLFSLEVWSECCFLFPSDMADVGGHLELDWATSCASSISCWHRNWQKDLVTNPERREWRAAYFPSAVLLWDVQDHWKNMKEWGGRDVLGSHWFTNIYWASTVCQTVFRVLRVKEYTRKTNLSAHRTYNLLEGNLFIYVLSHFSGEEKY